MKPKNTKDAQGQQVAQAVATGIIDELKRVTWPSREETIRLTIVVIAISLIIAFYIGIIDVLLAKLLEIIT
jgi:preprotein translocase SecE subunit